MVGDQLGDVRLRIEKSREMMRQVKAAVEQSKALINEAKTWRAEFQAGVGLPELDGDAPATG